MGSSDKVAWALLFCALFVMVWLLLSAQFRLVNGFLDPLAVLLLLRKAAVIAGVAIAGLFVFDKISNIHDLRGS